MNEKRENVNVSVKIEGEPENVKESENEIDDSGGVSVQVLVDPEGLMLKMEDGDEMPRYKCNFYYDSTLWVTKF